MNHSFSLSSFLHEFEKKEKALKDKALTTDLDSLKDKLTKKIKNTDLTHFNYSYEAPLELELLCIRLMENEQERQDILDFLLDTLNPVAKKNEFLFDDKNKKEYFVKNAKYLNCTNKDKLIKNALYNIEYYLDNNMLRNKEIDYLQFLPLFKYNTVESIRLISREKVPKTVKEQFLNSIDLSKNIYMEEREGTISIYHLSIFYALNKEMLIYFLDRGVPYKGQKRILKNKCAIIKQCMAHMKRDMDWGDSDIDFLKMHLERASLQESVEIKNHKPKINKI